MKLLQILSGGLFVIAGASLSYALLSVAGVLGASEPAAPPSPETRQIDSLEEAATQVEFDLAAPTAENWSFGGATVQRHPVQDGEIVFVAMMFRSDQGPLIQLEIVDHEVAPPVASGNPRPVMIQGTAGVLDLGGPENPNLAVVSWQQDGFTYHVTSFLDDSFDLDAFLGVVETIE